MFTPKWSNLINIVQISWNHQLDNVCVCQFVWKPKTLIPGIPCLELLCRIRHQPVFFGKQHSGVCFLPLLHQNHENWFHLFKLARDRKHDRLAPKWWFVSGKSSEISGGNPLKFQGNLGWWNYNLARFHIGRSNLQMYDDFQCFAQDVCVCVCVCVCVFENGQW